MSDLLQAIQVATVLVLGPLYAGVMARAEAIVQSKRGPGVFQPYRDLAKLLRKGSAISDQASWVFRGAPFVAFASYLTVAAIVPIITDQHIWLPAAHPVARADGSGFLSGVIVKLGVYGIALFGRSRGSCGRCSPVT